MEKLLQQILKEITPTEEERKEENELIEKLTEKLKSWELRPILVGSMAKRTDLRGEKDIDIFILFDKNVPREELEKKGLEIGKRLFNGFKIEYEIDYAEHPYVMGHKGRYTIEIVPCYETKELKSAVDRTPYHTKYVKRKLMQNKKLIDEIRLLKQFMKGVGIYGAEAKVQGFSGYLTELLVINYGSFENVLKATSNWKFGEIIDPEKLWKDREALKYFFPDAKLIIVDPVDKDRNAAAAVSAQKLAEFIFHAKEFIKSPKREFFFPRDEKPKSIEQLLKRMKFRGTKIIAISFRHERINPNTLFSQLRKTIDAISMTIEDAGFRILKSDFWTDEINQSIVLFDFEVWNLPVIKHHFGPPIDMNPKEQEKFLEKYKRYSPYIKHDRWVVDTKREFRKVEELLPKILKEKEGFGKNLREIKKFEILADEKILIRKQRFRSYDFPEENHIKIKNEDFLIFLGRFLPRV